LSNFEGLLHYFHFANHIESLPILDLYEDRMAFMRVCIYESKRLTRANINDINTAQRLRFFHFDLL